MANPTYATRRYVIAPGDSVQVARAADFVTALEASAPFKVSFDNQPRTDFEAGLTYDTESGFQLLEIINEGADPLTVKLGFGRGEIKDARLVLPGAVNVSGSVIRPNVPSQITGENITVWAGTNTVLAAENPLRAELILTNHGGSYGNVISLKNDQNITFANLQLGEKIVLTTTAEVRASATGQHSIVAVGEISWSA